MPIYAFACDACGHSFDRLQKLSDKDPDTCPECAAKAVHRQVTAPYFRLAGTGWYETDFKKDGDSKRNLAGDAGREKSTADSTSKDQSKPDSTTASKPAKPTKPNKGATTPA